MKREQRDAAWLALALHACSATGAQGRSLRALQWQAFEVSRTHFGRGEAAERALAVPGVKERLQAVAPALADLCSGTPVPAGSRLRRNVAVHAATLPQTDAPCAAAGAGPSGGPGLKALLSATRRRT